MPEQRIDNDQGIAVEVFDELLDERGLSIEFAGDTLLIRIESTILFRVKREYVAGIAIDSQGINLSRVSVDLYRITPAYDVDPELRRGNNETHKD